MGGRGRDGELEEEGWLEMRWGGGGVQMGKGGRGRDGEGGVEMGKCGERGRDGGGGG